MEYFKRTSDVMLQELLDAFGAVLIFNESSTFVPNILGLACMALLIWINADKEDAYDKV